MVAIAQMPVAEDLGWFLRQARPRRLRSMRRFAEEEIIIPDGPFAGRRFRCSRQPYCGLWFDAVDSARWSRCVATGPTQSGKTLSCFIIPLLYHLFEVGETVICGLPDMEMAGDKWREDILPSLEQSRYREFLPRQGGGSRGGRVDSIQFLNGATLKFMSGGGGDKSRAGFTSRVVVITETDGLDQPGSTSRESDKITQLEARTRAYGSRKRIYMECTVSTEHGRTWREYQAGTQSRIVLPCPHCHNWVAPEREHLTGWQGAGSLAAARTTGAFLCPSCDGIWSHEDREQANAKCRLLHHGQTIGSDGAVEGELPATDTLGFRWSGIHNLFLSAGDIAGDEWRAGKSTDEDNAEKEMRQFVWCIPVAPPKLDQTSLDATELAARTANWPKGLVPPDCRWLTAGVDLGKYLAHWVVVAWSDNATGHIVDYGRLEIPSQDLGADQGALVGLREFRDIVLAGWPQAGCANQPHVVPHQVWVDAGYLTEVVYAVCSESGERFRPCVGRGVRQQREQWSQRTTRTGSVVQHVGQGFHVNWLPQDQLHLAEIDADYWKTWVHLRLSSPKQCPGAMTIYQAHPHEHLSLAKHLTSEVQTEEFVAGKGLVVKWERLRRQNHWFDALYYASAAGHLCGVRLIAEPKEELVETPDIWGGESRPDGRDWMDVGWR